MKYIHKQQKYLNPRNIRFKNEKGHISRIIMINTLCLQSKYHFSFALEFLERNAQDIIHLRLFLWLSSLHTVIFSQTPTPTPSPPLLPFQCSLHPTLKKQGVIFRFIFLLYATKSKQKGWRLSIPYFFWENRLQQGFSYDQNTERKPKA